ncbi:MAG: hypothetical protein WC503_01065 [Candidatus Shapirobacteria bacterium]
MVAEPRVTNKKFVEVDKAFISACEKVGIKPTSRQASKYRAKKGLAFKSGR